MRPLIGSSPPHTTRLAEVHAITKRLRSTAPFLRVEAGALSDIRFPDRAERSVKGSRPAVRARLSPLRYAHPNSIANDSLTTLCAEHARAYAPAWESC